MSKPTPDQALLEFMFAPNEGYLISTFELPLRKHSAPVSEHQNLPEELSAEVDKPGTRLLSASIYRKGLWFLCVHRTGLEHLFKNTSRLSSALQDSFDNLKATSQSTRRSPRSITFGGLPGSFCIVLNDEEIIKLGVPQDCDDILEGYNDSLRQNRTRSDGDLTRSKGIALGAAGTWIIYDGDKHFWGGRALPQGLVEALELGEREGWSIKTAKLSIFNPEEYFLLYQNGKVWYNVHRSFENKLRSVVLAWALMQELDEVTFTTIVPNEYIAYNELLMKILRSTLKAYPPLFNEALVHYTRQGFDRRYSYGEVRNENTRGVSPKGRDSAPNNKSRFVQDASQVQVKRSQSGITMAKNQKYGQLYMDLFSDLAIATFPVNSIVWKIFGRFRSVDGLGESPLEDRKQRVRWTCGCGHRLYDDFEPLETDALLDLVDLLNQYSQGDKASEKRNHTAQIFGTIWNWVTRHFTGSAITPRPRGDTEGQRPANFDVTTRAAVSPTRRKNLHLLCCIPTDRSSEGFTLCHEPLDDIANDAELFKLLRKALYGPRSNVFSLFSLKKIKSIRIVKFWLSPSNYVEVQDHSQSCRSTSCTCLPPSHLVEPSASATYRCDPIPPAQHPPVGINFLRHQFNNPKCQGKEHTWFYNQTPKWTAGILRAPNNRRVQGWGIQMECETHQRKLRLMMIAFCAVGALIIGLGYKDRTETPDLTTAFTIIGSWIAACGVSFAVLQNL